MAERKVSLKDASAKEAKAKDAALEAAVTGIKREFGEGSIRSRPGRWPWIWHSG